MSNLPCRAVLKPRDMRMLWAVTKNEPQQIPLLCSFHPFHPFHPFQMICLILGHGHGNLTARMSHSVLLLLLSARQLRMSSHPRDACRRYTTLAFGVLQTPPTPHTPKGNSCDIRGCRLLAPPRCRPAHDWSWASAFQTLLFGSCGFRVPTRSQRDIISIQSKVRIQRPD